MNLRRERFSASLAWLTLLSVLQTFACGPDFPNRLLDGGDEVILAAPFANFYREIQRMQLVKTTFTAVPLAESQSHDQQTAAIDFDDLRVALRKAGVPARDRSTIVQRYEVERTRLNFKIAKESVRGDAAIPDENLEEVVRVPDGMPGEFADYFRGAIAWHSGETNAAVEAWQSVLGLPAKERRFRSTWAAYMLGRAMLHEDSAKATNYFRQVRTLARDGCVDSLGLAASSLGWEAKVHYDHGNFLDAALLYLEQADTGDESAIVSLMWTAAKAVRIGGAQLDRFARDSTAQRVVTAYLLKEHSAQNEPDHFVPDADAVGRWLAAVETSRTRDVRSAEQLALASYRYGHLDRARRWLKLARNTPTAEWLRAKLLLRDGKINEAAAILSRASRYFPLSPQDDPQKPAGLEESLYAEAGGHTISSGARQFWGELGVLKLARGEYAEALDALLRSGFRDDASYVAEQVLTLDELKSFVDRKWNLAIDDSDEPEDGVELTWSENAERKRIAGVQTDLRHLLGRRLVRNNRASEARPYFPNECFPKLDALMGALDAGWNVGQPAEDRAKKLMVAARIARHDGMELLGTALEPDFANYGGDFEMAVIRNARTAKTAASSAERAMSDKHGDVGRRILQASDDELRRASGEPSDPPQRFHYRYLASELGWAAAQLLPDNSDETARILCEAGSWIKYLNPTAADRFYKSLVRRCRKTDIGRWADYIRWFPLLDEDGNLRPAQPGPPRRKVEDSSTDADDQSGESANERPDDGVEIPRLSLER